MKFCGILCKLHDPQKSKGMWITNLGKFLFVYVFGDRLVPMDSVTLVDRVYVPPWVDLDVWMSKDEFTDRLGEKMDRNGCKHK